VRSIESISDFLFISTYILAAVILAGIFTIARPDLAHYLLLLLATLLVFVGASKLKRYSDKKDWIQSAAVLETVVERSKAIIESQYGAKRKYLYPEVEYEYIHDGQKYKSTALAESIQDVWVPEINMLGEKTPEAKKPWRNWGPGLKVPVYINPKDPRQTVILNQLSQKRRSHHLALIVSGVLIFFAWLLIVAVF